MASTVIWNQWCKPLTEDYWQPQNTNYASVSFNDGIATRTMIADPTEVYQSSIRAKTSYNFNYHIDKYYYQKLELYTPKSAQYILVIANSWVAHKIIPANEWTIIEAIHKSTVERSAPVYLMYCISSSYEGDICTCKNPIHIDLTQMYGAGNEPTTVEDFRKQCEINGIDLNQALSYDTGTEIFWRFDATSESLLSARRSTILGSSPHLETFGGTICNLESNIQTSLKKCKVYLKPKQSGSGEPSLNNIRPITGYSEINLYQFSENLLVPDPKENYFSLGINWSVKENGYVDYEGICTSQAGVLVGYVYVPEGVTSIVGKILGDSGHIAFNTANIYDSSGTFLGKVSSGWEKASENDNDLPVIDLTQYPSAYKISISIKRALWNNVPMKGRCYILINGNEMKYKKQTIEFPPAGKNLFNIDAPFADPNNVAFGSGSNRIFKPNTCFLGASSTNYVVYSDQSYSVNNDILTINTKSGYGLGYSFRLQPSTTYTINATFGGESDKVGIGICSYSSNGEYTMIRESVPRAQLPYTFTTLSNTDIILIVFKAYDSESYETDIPITNIQLELGSTATTWEPYKYPTYGGYIDITNGIFVQEWECIRFQPTWNWYRYEPYSIEHSHHFIQYYANTLPLSVANEHDRTVLSNMFRPLANINDREYAQNNKTLYRSMYAYCVRYDEIETLEEWKQFVTNNNIYAAGKLVTPITTQLTPNQIKISKGNNYILSDYGDIIVNKHWTYKHDKHAINVLWNQRALSLNENNWHARQETPQPVEVVFSPNETATVTWLVDNAVSYHGVIIFKKGISFTNGDIYYVSYMINPQVDNLLWGMEINSRQNFSILRAPQNKWNRISWRVDMRRTISYTYLYIPGLSGRQSISAGSTCMVKSPIIINLTKMYGTGNEPTKEEFERQCYLNGIDLTQFQPYNDTGTNITWYI